MKHGALMQDHGMTKVPTRDNVRRLRQYLHSKSPPIVLAAARLIAMLLSAEDVSLQESKASAMQDCQDK